MASASRAAWRRIKRSIAGQVAADVAPLVEVQTRDVAARLAAVDAQLEAMRAQLAAMADQMHDLREIAGTQVDIENQSTELLGRLLRSATSRIDELEERVFPGQ
ncbi:MAG: hypothetical protein ACYDGN_00410 [Acidimicrobiales bacterium]